MSTKIKILGYIYNIKRNKNVKNKLWNLMTLCSGETDVLKCMVKTVLSKSTG